MKRMIAAACLAALIAASGQPAPAAESADKDRDATPGMAEMLLSRDRNPMVMAIMTMSENCPVDFVGLGKDIGVSAGLIAPEKDQPQRGLWEKTVSRSCLLSRLFGDDTCPVDKGR